MRHPPGAAGAALSQPRRPAGRPERWRRGTRAATRRSSPSRVADWHQQPREPRSRLSCTGSRSCAASTTRRIAFSCPRRVWCRGQSAAHEAGEERAAELQPPVASSRAGSGGRAISAGSSRREKARAMRHHLSALRHGPLSRALRRLSAPERARRAEQRTTRVEADDRWGAPTAATPEAAEAAAAALRAESAKGPRARRRPAAPKRRRRRGRRWPRNASQRRVWRSTRARRGRGHSLRPIRETAPRRGRGRGVGRGPGGGAAVGADDKDRGDDAQRRRPDTHVSARRRGGGGGLAQRGMLPTRVARRHRVLLDAGRGGDVDGDGGEDASCKISENFSVYSNIQ